MFCEKCGKNLPDGIQFCDGCGAKIEAVRPEYKATAESAQAQSNSPPPAQTGYVQQQEYAPQPQAYTQNPAQTVYPQQQAYTPPPPIYSGQSNSEPLRVGQYIGMLLLMLIPIVSIIMLLVWSFGGSVNLNKKNFARAMLIVSAISIVLSLIFSTVLISSMRELFRNMGGYY